MGNAARNATKVVAPARGIAAGVKSKNKHLQEFENMKNQYKKRKGESLFSLCVCLFDCLFVCLFDCLFICIYNTNMRALRVKEDPW